MARQREEVGRMCSYRPGIEVTVEPCEDVPPPIKVKELMAGASKARTWEDCEECGNEIWYDHALREFYHKLACSRTNGIGYGTEISKAPLVKHHIACDCLCCSKDIGRREAVL